VKGNEAMGLGLFRAFCATKGVPPATAEFRFHPKRKWRFDYAWPEHKIALEIDGGVWIRGRHNRAPGFLRDMEKMNEAALLGWRVLRCTPEQFANGDVIALLERIFSKEAHR
jgi:very-short-patch-repair endonuclease